MHSCKNIWIDSMKNLLKIVIMALPYLLNWIDDRMRERRRKERQAKRDEAAKDPGSMFSSEFAGGWVRDASDEDAAKAAKADPGSDGKS